MSYMIFLRSFEYNFAIISAKFEQVFNEISSGFERKITNLLSIYNYFEVPSGAAEQRETGRLTIWVSEFKNPIIFDTAPCSGLLSFWRLGGVFFGWRGLQCCLAGGS